MICTDHSVWLNSSDTWPKTTIGKASIVPGHAEGFRFELVSLGSFGIILWTERILIEFRIFKTKHTSSISRSGTAIDAGTHRARQSPYVMPRQ